MSHTPGPWTIEEYGDEDAPSLVIHKDSGTRVCFMATPGSHGDPARIEADAHLIAAAPDMYEAIEQALDDMGVEGRCDCGQAKEMLRAALAKATGESK